MSMDIRYIEVKAGDVASYFVKDFEFKDGSELRSYDWFFDPAKGVFVFKLVVNNPEQGGAK